MMKVQPFCFSLLRFSVVIIAISCFLGANLASADSFNWENINGQSWLTSVKDQKSTGMCWDFAACGVLEAKYMLTRNDNSYKPDVSEQQLVCEDQWMGDVGGGYQSLALNYLTSHGAAVETECPFTEAQDSAVWDANVAQYGYGLAPGWENRMFKSTANSNYLGTSIADVKNYVKTIGPLALFMRADDDFYIPSPGSYRGNHSIVIVGFTDNASAPGGGYWIIKNSWGAGWNSGGPTYMRMGYGAVDFSHRPKSSSDVCGINGQVYYTGAMATVTWKGGTASWQKNGNNWSGVDQAGNTLTSFAWDNKEASATFSGTGTTVPVSGIVIAHGLTIASGSTGYAFTGGGALTVTNGGITANESVTISPPLSVGAPQTWTVVGGKSMTVGTVHTIVSPLTLQTTGDATITGSIDGGGVLNTAGGAAPGTITKAGSGTLFLSGSATYAAPLVLSAGTLNFSQPAGVSANFTGAISGSGAGPVVKSGGGVVTLAGINTYSAETDVNAGTLLINGSMKTNGLTVVNTDGILGGTGTAGLVRVNSGGHLAPGVNGVGVFKLGNSLTLNSGAKLDFDLDTPAASDQVLMASYTLALASQQFSDFNFTAFSNFGSGTYTLIDAYSITGSLGSVKSGWINGFSATLSLASGNLMLTVVPEPAVWISLLMGAAGMLAYARLRRK
jgi:autotransporter-associated beta strand protein